MSSKFIIIRVLLFVLLVVGTTSAMIAQDNDFTTWTKFKVNHKIDSRFAVSVSYTHLTLPTILLV